MATDHAAGSRGSALVADDDVSGRIMLRSLLKRLGFTVTLAEDGEAAVEALAAQHFDLIFLDILMPRLDGIEACRRIKAVCEHFVPVIFITGTTDEADLARCIEAGGDDFLVKPFSPTVLAAKVRALERIRDLQRRVEVLLARMQEDQTLAERVFRRAVLAGNVEPAGLSTHLVPAETFSGDLVLSAYSPSGDLNLLMGDFTGHGLAAALGAMPTAEVFRSMTQKGFAPALILGEINRKLRALLPTGIFLAANFVHVKHDLSGVEVANCGMPTGLLIGPAGSKCGFASTHPPLAALDEQDFEAAMQPVLFDRGDLLLLASDGVFEATSAVGEHFGERFGAAVASRPADPLTQVIEDLAAFMGEAAQLDDMSLVQLRLDDRLVRNQASAAAPGRTSSRANGMGGQGGARVVIELHEQYLARVDPVPLLLSQLDELGQVGALHSTLFTVLTELYLNALDHGVLGLDSTLKQAKDGFWHYLAERQRRIEALTAGWVSIGISCGGSPQEQNLCIEVRDSGQGFDWLTRTAPESVQPHGRGIELVRQLTESLRYEGCGNHVEAVLLNRRE